MWGRQRQYATEVVARMLTCICGASCRAGSQLLEPVLAGLVQLQLPAGAVACVVSDMLQARASGQQFQAL
jgi:hypothetical protein